MSIAVRNEFLSVYVSADTAQFKASQRLLSCQEVFVLRCHQRSESDYCAVERRNEHYEKVQNF